MRISDWSSDWCSAELTANGVTVGETIGDHYFATSSRSFRTQKTSEIRDGLIGAIQWRPSPEFEIAIDGQYSKRRSLEDRNVLGIPEGLRGLEPLVIGNGSNGYRSEEHTSELQSLMRISYAVFCLKKKNQDKQTK